MATEPERPKASAIATAWPFEVIEVVSCAVMVIALALTPSPAESAM